MLWAADSFVSGFSVVAVLSYHGKEMDYCHYMNWHVVVSCLNHSSSYM